MIRRKCLLKVWFGEMVTIKFLQEVGELTFNKGWKYLQRGGGGGLKGKVGGKNMGGGGGLDKESMEKKYRGEGVSDPQRDYE